MRGTESRGRHREHATGVSVYRAGRAGGCSLAARAVRAVGWSVSATRTGATESRADRPVWRATAWGGLEFDARVGDPQHAARAALFAIVSVVTCSPQEEQLCTMSIAAHRMCTIRHPLAGRASLRSLSRLG